MRRVRLLIKKIDIYIIFDYGFVKNYNSFFYYYLKNFA